ncbi:MAG TPA: hypothetical protein VGO52_16490 [Hyphomonadaceae bacterium]|jgi:hypothetical protein|nr:hypothetical protein [Hyphomonadaceae bacterium]
MTAATLPTLEAPVGETARKTRSFYIRMAVAFLVIALIGFSMSYWVPLATGQFKGGPLVHIHGLAYVGWLVLLLTQSILASRGEMRNHRAWGVAGVSLATAMVLLGEAVMLHALTNGLATGGGDRVRAFAFMTGTLPLVFGGMVTAAILNVSKPETHKRLILIATICILQAATDRLVALLIRPFAAMYASSLGLAVPGPDAPPTPEFLAAVWFVPVIIFNGGTVLTDLLMVAGIVHDKRTTGRIHPAWLIGGGILVAYQILRIPLSTTQAWYGVADWLVKSFG